MLGANVRSIVVLLAVDFIKMVLIAVIIGSPVAWMLMHNWLQSFAYHVGVQWWVFIVAAIVVIFISFFTICLQSVKAAMDNPIKNLRNE